MGISAGLQDRVIQTYGGVVHMDFSPTANTSSPYTPLDAALLPDLYLAYDMHAGDKKYFLFEKDDLNIWSEVPM